MEITSVFYHSFLEEYKTMYYTILQVLPLQSVRASNFYVWICTYVYTYIYIYIIYMYTYIYIYVDQYLYILYTIIKHNASFKIRIVKIRTTLKICNFIMPLSVYASTLNHTTSPIPRSSHQKINVLISVKREQYHYEHSFQAKITIV